MSESGADSHLVFRADEIVPYQGWRDALEAHRQLLDWTLGVIGFFETNRLAEMLDSEKMEKIVDDVRRMQQNYVYLEHGIWMVGSLAWYHKAIEDATPFHAPPVAIGGVYGVSAAGTLLFFIDQLLSDLSRVYGQLLPRVDFSESSEVPWLAEEPLVESWRRTPPPKIVEGRSSQWGYFIEDRLLREAKAVDWEEQTKGAAVQAGDGGRSGEAGS